MIFSDLINLPAIEDYLPAIGRPVSRRVTSFGDDGATLTVRLMGVPFESVNRREIEIRYDALNRFFAAMAKEKGNRLALWTSFRHRKIEFGQTYEFRSSFMRGYSAKYLAQFRDQDYFESLFHLTAVLRGDDLRETVKELEELGDAILKTLAGYDPEPLGVFIRNSVLFSEPFQFIAELINGVDEPIPVTQVTGRELIGSSWLHFHYDTVEIRTNDRTRFASCYDLKDYPKAGWGQLNELLKLPVEFTLTQSFGCLTTSEALKAIEDKENELLSAQDRATHQLGELKDAKAFIAGGDLAFGDYHGALVVYGETPERAIANGTTVTSKSLNECGLRWVKATASMPFTYMSQVPGYRYKPRPMPKSTRNLASTFTMHNYSTGKAKGNPIGDGSALLPLKTVAKSLYNMNLHASRRDEDNTGEKIAGHTLLLGATGTGKTVLQLTLLGFLERFDPKIFALDLDRGMQIFIEELGGLYFPLVAGEPTGIAPFALPDTTRNREHVYDLVGVCGRDEYGRLSSQEMAQIKHAVDTVFAIERIEDRVFSRLLESIPDQGGNSLATRLSHWCYSRGGRFAWALDNVPNRMIDVAKQRRIGFDVTDFLKKDYPPTEPVLGHLLYLKDQMQAHGGLLATIVEEFWLPASYPTTAGMILKTLKTGRKAEEFMVLVSQSPEDAINSPVFAAIRDQTATKIYLPNPEASRESYQKLNLTDRELDKLLALEKESRTFLIKQSNQSAFATLDLHGFSDEIAVLSGSLDNVAIWEEVKREAGSDPERRMALFQARRKGRKNKKAVPTREAMA
ncbi:transporter [Trinickia dabaoshanensis]|uniref:Transporter n=1 Tax=Trinickia dabaoshanensis TaxID=564714 RepID=A0A2N7VEM4_9BURK|nr:transporter [Trinickia dabaoshanensis]PMS15611.1 transporter [Trinickia dabaoshanensis]